MTIKSPKEHHKALKEISSLMSAKPGTKEGNRLCKLVKLVEVYEAKHFPINQPIGPFIVFDGQFHRQVTENLAKVVKKPLAFHRRHTLMMLTLLACRDWINDECERRGKEDQEYENPACDMVKLIDAALARVESGKP